VVLVLRYLLDLSDAQIADILGISPAGVRSQAHRGLHTLRERTELTGSAIPKPRPEPQDKDEPASARRLP
jgi:DNA-directed RNA polymerase specialized sigma24 family protein